MTDIGKPWFAWGLLFWMSLAPLALADGKAVAKEVVKGSTGKIQWGKHWAGPELKGAKSLEGKVVLLKIWGG